jgi:hypothetical protein
MRWWFGTRRAQLASGSQPAYDPGRRDEQEAEADNHVARRDLAAAYERGRRDEARRRRGSPLLSLLVLIIIVGAALLVYLAARDGSFASGGAVVDNNLAQATNTVQAPFRHAANRAGDALQNAGQRLKQDAGPANP